MRQEMSVDDQQLAQTLRAMSLLKGLRPIECKRLLACFVLREVPAGTLICREGSPGEAMTLVQAGTVKVTKRGPDGAQKRALD